MSLKIVGPALEVSDTTLAIGNALLCAVILLRLRFSDSSPNMQATPLTEEANSATCSPSTRMPSIVS